MPSFGAAAPRIVLIGLAPGMHGANRTARPFTGDYAGILLYETLHELGLATQPTSVSADDPLKLVNARIVNAVKCVPPENKPMPDEIAPLQRLPEGRAGTAEVRRVSMWRWAASRTTPC